MCVCLSCAVSRADAQARLRFLGAGEGGEAKNRATRVTQNPTLDPFPFPFLPSPIAPRPTPTHAASTLDTPIHTHTMHTVTLRPTAARPQARAARRAPARPHASGGCGCGSSSPASSGGGGYSNKSSVSTTPVSTGREFPADMPPLTRADVAAAAGATNAPRDDEAVVEGERVIDVNALLRELSGPPDPNDPDADLAAYMV